MKTLLFALALVCAGTNTLLLADWARRGEALWAAAATAMLLLCVLVGILTRRLRI